VETTIPYLEERVPNIFRTRCGVARPLFLARRFGNESFARQGARGRRKRDFLKAANEIASTVGAVA